MDNKFKAARMASDMTLDAGGDACGLSRITYRQREINPGDFRLSELKGLYKILSPTARPILVEAVGLFICTDDYV